MVIASSKLAPTLSRWPARAEAAQVIFDLDGVLVFLFCFGYLERICAKQEIYGCITRIKILTWLSWYEGLFTAKNGGGVWCSLAIFGYEEAASLQRWKQRVARYDWLD